MTARRLALAMVAIGLALAPALAQQSRPPAAPAAKADPPPAAPEPPAPPYERDILRLSEIMGALAFLRTLCTATDATQWPQRMQALLDAEGVILSRRERLAGAYNRGYGAFSLTYRSCTPSAAEATERYLKEGNALSQMLASRYGG